MYSKYFEVILENPIAKKVAEVLLYLYKSTSGGEAPNA